MSVPAPVVELDEANIAFAEAPGEQAIVRKTVLARLSPITLVNVLRFARNVSGLRHAHLHAECEFVLTDAGESFRVAEFLRRPGIECVDRVNGRASLLAGDALGILREENRLPVSLALHAL